MSRIHCEYQEINTGPSTGNRIPGSVCGLTRNGNQASPSENQANSSRSSQAGKTGNDYSTTTRQDECHKLFPSTWTPVLSPSADGTDQHIGAELQMLRSTSSPNTSMQRGIGMVGQQHVQVEWQSTYSEGHRSGDRLRCIPGGMGDLLLQAENRGPWSQQGLFMHINCLKLLAATLAVITFAKAKTAMSILLRIDNPTAVAYINNLGGTASKELVILIRNLWMWCLERNIHIAAVHRIEYSSRYRVQANGVQDRLEVEFCDIPENQQPFWAPGQINTCSFIDGLRWHKSPITKPTKPGVICGLSSFSTTSVLLNP